MRTVGGRGGRGSWGWGLKTDIYIDMGSFEIGQRFEIFIFRGPPGWGDSLGVWGQISAMLIL